MTKISRNQNQQNYLKAIFNTKRLNVHIVYQCQFCYRRLVFWILEMQLKLQPIINVFRTSYHYPQNPLFSESYLFLYSLHLKLSDSVFYTICLLCFEFLKQNLCFNYSVEFFTHQNISAKLKPSSKILQTCQSGAEKGQFCERKKLEGKKLATLFL